LAHPAGLVSSSILAEKQALELVSTITTVTHSFSPIITFSLAVIVKVVYVPLLKDLYVIMDTAAAISTGLQHTRLTLMQPQPMIAISICNTFLPMLVLNLTKLLIILPNIMQVPFHQRTNIVQILNYLH
jgi:hypothetical protein